MSATVPEVIDLLTETLALGERGRRLTAESPLLGHVAELDSMAVLAVIQAMEERFGFRVDDDEVSAATFDSVGSLAEFVDAKRRDASSRPTLTA
jgi:acyl carrier protein